MTKDIPGACGFLEEGPGVRSMTRLVMLVLSLLTAGVVGTICVYVLRSASPDAQVVLGLAGVLGALVLNGIVAIARRGGD